MRIFGFELTLQKANLPAINSLSSTSASGSWWPIVAHEPFTGAWQRNQEMRQETVLAFHAVYSCVTLIAQDISKLRVRLMQQDIDNGIWQETTVAAFSPVLRKPNRYQNRIKFYENWITSKLIHGNTYVLLQRDSRQVVTAMYILDPTRTKPLIAPDGDVFYQLSRDDLNGVPEENVVVPSSEIIHDVMVPLYHPLCGVSPLTACGLAAAQGISIQRHSSRFFRNGSNPGGILTAPGIINEDTAKRLKQAWEDNYSGENFGRVAVLGDGLKYEAMSVNATDSQLIEQLQWSSENVASAFHVPAYMIGVGSPPAYNNVEALNQQYYSQCLQNLIENIEECLNYGIGLYGITGKSYKTQFDLDDLLRMDTATKIESINKAVGAGWMILNEARAKFDLPPMEGGDAAYLQQQNFSVAALAKRDAQADPFAAKLPESPKPADAPPNPGPASKAALTDEGGETDDFDATEAMQLGWELKFILARQAA